MTVLELMEIVQLVTAKFRSAKVASFYPAFISNCLTIGHNCQPYLLSTGVAIGPFEVSCGEGDVAVIRKVGMSYCDTSR